MIDRERVKLLRGGTTTTGPILYWMSRDQRGHDNWALSFAQNLAMTMKVPVLVCFCLVPSFIGATLRAYDFMLRGLQETEKDLLDSNIPFIMLYGHPSRTIPKLTAELSVSALVTDFDPLRIKRKWKDQLKDGLTIPFYEVDSHNIVPCWAASDKKEFAARTIRPKIKKLLKRYLTPPPQMIRHPYTIENALDQVEWNRALSFVEADASVPLVSWLKPGCGAGILVLRKFVSDRLDKYHLHKNDPNADALSDLSPYIHFGQISAQRIAIEVLKSGHDEDSVETFIEELIIRKELADNFCLHTSQYDKSDAFPEWAKKTLNDHLTDKREYTYSRSDLEEGQTHDRLWNAGQAEMTSRGKMHGWMRMYWAKKILEWSTSPEEAMEKAIYLNDKYELDGRDPNGYAGIAWSLGGVHDRPWPSHPVFGNVRYMNYRGAKRKFDVEAYIRKFKA